MHWYVAVQLSIGALGGENAVYCLHLPTVEPSSTRGFDAFMLGVYNVHGVDTRNDVGHRTLVNVFFLNLSHDCASTGHTKRSSVILVVQLTVIFVVVVAKEIYWRVLIMFLLEC